ncbi:MAG: hypothetical protein E6R08_02385 [Nevskiaceae bacterium]|jgi:hypothetical protein|nr:MAG: hypothetical protein EKK33_05955 [Bradyrhizobiaceae bacterium]TXG99290.1 MAG: hypothetical protein E6R08_02385 [Nevskiaceae bacterium]
MAEKPTWTEGLREVMSAVLSSVIAVVAMYMLWRTFAVAGQPIELVGDKPNPALTDAYQRQKDILLIAIGLLGTVTGYYLGRVPAERGADAARQAQKAAEKSANDVRDAGAKAAGSFQTALDKLSAGQNVKTQDQQALTEALSNFRATLR